MSSASRSTRTFVRRPGSRGPSRTRRSGARSGPAILRSTVVRVTRTRLLVGGAVVLVIVLVLSAVDVARDLSRVCTAVGCTDLVSYDIPDAAYVAWGAGWQESVLVETCIGDECQTVEVSTSRNGVIRSEWPAASFPAGTLDAGVAHRVTLRVTDPSGAVRYARSDTGVTLTEFQPNGPDCDPTCAAWLLALEPQDPGV